MYAYTYTLHMHMYCNRRIAYVTNRSKHELVCHIGMHPQESKFQFKESSNLDSVEQGWMML